MSNPAFVFNQWWISKGYNQFKEDTRPPKEDEPDKPAYDTAPKKWHKIDYAGSMVGQYNLSYNGQGQQILSFKALEPLREHDTRLDEIVTILREQGYEYEFTDNDLILWMTLGDKWGSILKTVAYVFNQLAEDD